MNSKKTFLLLFLIFLLGFILRFWKLESLPAILNRDEAALAYNAYLLRQSGQDEWQQSWPLFFKSFGDYKLPLYPYTLTALFYFFEPSDFLVRLPSAFAGSLLILVSFFISYSLFKLSKPAALFVALLIALNPVFFFYSRIAFEANLALLLFTLAVYCIFKQKTFLAGLFFVLAIAGYNTPLLLLPFLIPILIYYFSFRNPKKWVFSSLLVGAIFVGGLLALLQLTSQKSNITIFQDPSTWEQFAAYRQEFSGIWQSILGNKYLYYVKLMASNFFESFSLSFLVQEGGSHPWHTLPGFGHLFYLTYFLGLCMIIDILGEMCIAWFDRNYSVKKTHILALYLAVIALAPSVVTIDSPHATRSLFFFFMIIIFAGMFIDRILKVFSKRRTSIVLLFLLFLGAESGWYYYHYFTQYQDRQPKSLFVDYKRVLNESQSLYPADQPLAVVDHGGYQYIVTAWYLRVPSQDFFATMKYQAADAINFYYGEQLLNYHFIKTKLDQNETEVLIYETKD